MFTGLIETTGTILEKQTTAEGTNFTIQASFFNSDLKLGDSISINGVCQTITQLKSKNEIFVVYSSYRTLEITNLSFLQIGELVNLERAVLPSTRMGGHIVQGHVDDVGTIVLKTSRDEGKVEVFEVEVPLHLTPYIVERGSIAVDGISLTVVSIVNNKMQLVLIPETIQKTNAKFWTVGKKVNLEVDILARYIEKQLQNFKLSAI